MTRFGKALLAGGSLLALIGAAEAQFTPGGSFVPTSISQITGLGTGVATALALATNATGGVATNGGAWNSFTVAPFCTGSQTGTTFTSSGRFAEGPNRLVTASAHIALSAFNTCTGNLAFSLPVTAEVPSGKVLVCHIFESGVTATYGYVYTTGGNGTVERYDANAFLPANSSYSYEVQCAYEGAT